MYGCYCLPVPHCCIYILCYLLKGQFTHYLLLLLHVNGKGSFCPFFFIFASVKFTRLLSVISVFGGIFPLMPPYSVSHLILPALRGWDSCKQQIAGHNALVVGVQSQRRIGVCLPRVPSLPQF